MTGPLWIDPICVGVSGSYGGLNLGDEAILEGILRELRAAVPVEVTVFSRNPDDTLKRHGVERALPVREMSREQVRAEIARLDLLILGGGGILFDAEVGIYLREVLLAHEARVPVFVYAIRAGPLERPESRTVVKEAFDRAAMISVRERPSQHLLESIGVQQEIHITADPALLLEPQPLPRTRSSVRNQTAGTMAGRRLRTRARCRSSRSRCRSISRIARQRRRLSGRAV